jgi:hypothetical protein
MTPTVTRAAVLAIISRMPLYLKILDSLAGGLGPYFNFIDQVEPLLWILLFFILVIALLSIFRGRSFQQFGMGFLNAVLIPTLLVVGLSCFLLPKHLKGDDAAGLAMIYLFGGAGMLVLGFLLGLRRLIKNPPDARSFNKKLWLLPILCGLYFAPGLSWTLLYNAISNLAMTNEDPIVGDQILALNLVKQSRLKDAFLDNLRVSPHVFEAELKDFHDNYRPETPLPGFVTNPRMPCRVLEQLVQDPIFRNRPPDERDMERQIAEGNWHTRRCDSGT